MGSGLSAEVTTPARDGPRRQRPMCRMAHNPEVAGSNSARYQAKWPSREDLEGHFHGPCSKMCSK
jgi:hypothetical protein